MRGHKKLVVVLLLSFVIEFTKLSAFNGDTLTPVKLPRHYFNSTIYADLYSPSRRELDTVNTISKRLKSYKISQLTLGFNIPVFTKDYFNKDSTRIKNLHIMVTGGITNLYLDFEGISRHTLSKTYVGFRGLYNNGKKSLFFVEVAPFTTVDRGYKNTRTLRLSTTLLYNWSVNESFALRVGYTRSFLYGNLFNLPYIGIRVGKLTKTNISIQFPRSITFTVPIGKYVRTSIYTKPQGGFYTFANTKDSIALGSVYENKKLLFGRTEFLAGARIDVLPTKHFNFYLSAGFTTNNRIEFFPSSSKANVLYMYNQYYREKIKSSGFINLGMVFRIGKTKSIYNNLQLYNAVDMNNNSNAGDNAIIHNNAELPNGKVKMGRNKTDDVMDLIEAQDLY